MDALLTSFTEQIAAQSIYEYVAVIFALGYVWLAARQNILCWLCAMVSTSLYTWIFWEVSLPFHTALNGYYLMMAVYGWYTWNRQESVKPIASWPVLRHVKWIAVLSIIGFGLCVFAAEWFPGDFLYFDAFITVFSVFTTVLVAHKILQNWHYWIVINGISVYLFYAKGLYPTALLTILYFLFSFYGYMQWQKSIHNNAIEDPSGSIAN